MNVDLSTTVLFVTAISNEAVLGFQNAHNADFLMSAGLSEDEEGSLGSRESTPFIELRPTRCVLRTNHYPNDPQCGWSFGYDLERCDFYLGKKMWGVSDIHFRIDHNWTAKSLVIINMSQHGIQVADPATGDYERVFTSRVIMEAEQMKVGAGLVEMTLNIPRRGPHQETYDMNLEILRKEVEMAMPRIDGVRIHQPAWLTPKVVGEKRKYILQQSIGVGAFATVYKAIDHQNGNVFAAKEFKHLDKKGLTSAMEEIRLLQSIKHVS
jgi:hypothetical protein